MWEGRLHILFLILFITNSLYAQEYLPPEVLSVESGLSSRQVNSVAVDQHGLLWAGTNNGLNRYNGYSFNQFFTTTSGNGYSGIQIIRKIVSDKDGNLWVLNEGGINRMDHKTGEITKYPVSMFEDANSRGAVLTDAYPASDGTVWILTDRSLVRISPDQNIGKFPIPDTLIPANWNPTSIAADLSRNIWIGTTGGLLLYSVQQNMFKIIVGENSQGLLSNNVVQCLFIDTENILWVGTRNGMNRVDPVDFSFYQYYPGGSPVFQPGNSVSDIDASGSDQIIMATGAGIVILDKTNLQFRNIHLAGTNRVNSVSVDPYGIIWGGTVQGILKIRESRLSVRNFNSQTPELKLVDDHVVAVLEQRVPNKVFVGYGKDGYSVVDILTKSSIHYNTVDGSRVVGFYPFRPEEYLVLSEHDIEVFTSGSRRSDLFRSFSFLNRDLVKNQTLNSLYYDGESGIWLGTSEGLQCIRIDSARHYSLNSLRYQGQQLTIGKVHDIERDLSGNFWLGTDNGLIFFNPVKGNFNRYTPYDVELLNTEHKAVYTIISEGPGIFWLGTSAGVFRFDASSRQFTTIDRKPELMNAVVRALSIDLSGNIWIGTETGLFCYVRATNTIKSFDVKEGLLNDSYTAICRGIEDKMYLGGPRGLSVINLLEMKEKNVIPEVIITGIRYLDNSMRKQDLYYQVSDTIVLPWHRKPIQIEFAVTDFTRPEFNQYRYSFGKTKEEIKWQLLGSQNFLMLDRLSPGKYRLNVAGSDAEMHWNNKGMSLIIIVEAPYWRSTYGLALMIVAGLVLVFLFLRFWIRQFFNLSRENQEREMFAKQIMLQKEELTLKNKAITDSINYAKRIQTAMLPPYKLFKSIFPSSFILFMPKDIVSGDFYWVNKVGNRIFISAVDCTGHGVPGAFMSIIGFELFRKITNIEGLTRPSDILNRLNDDFHEIFKDVDNVVLRDGMDVAFCSIDKKDMILEFAGAFNPLYLIRDNKIMEVKGDRFAIGLDEINFREQTFKNHIIPIQKGDIVYIFSDGFADQFGGPDGKKYKYRRFRHLLLNLHQLPMEKQHEILENNVMEWRGTQEQVDDILVIGIKIDF